MDMIIVIITKMETGVNSETKIAFDAYLSSF